MQILDFRFEIGVGSEFLESIRDRSRSACLGEIVIVAPRPGGRVLLHTKSFYPEGTYRLPTGGIKPGEKPEDAFFREFREELGFDGETDRLVGIVHHHFVSETDSADFDSYIYLARESVAEPMSADSGEEITGFIEVAASELPDVAEKLRNLTGRWSDWGKFRAVAHEFAHEAVT